MTNFKVNDKVKASKNEEDFDAEKFTIRGVVNKINGPILFIDIVGEGIKLIPAKYAVIDKIDTTISIEKLVESKFEIKVPMTLYVKDRLESANQYLIVPLVPKEKVIVISIEEDPNYIKVKHNHGKTTAIFNRIHFTNVLKSAIVN